MKLSFKVAELTGKTSPWQVTVLKLILIKHHFRHDLQSRKQIDVSRAIEKSHLIANKKGF
jgi:hypothetical protein